MILRFGRFRHSGKDFNEERNHALATLQAFVPRSSSSLIPLHWLNPVKNLLMKNLYLRSFITQASIARQSVTPHGGHLHAPFLNIAYVRIPKAASTSLSYSMLKVIYPGLSSIPLDPREINFLTDANLRRSVSQLDHNDIFFTVVRNPFARMVSVYRDYISNPNQENVFEDYLFGILSQGLSFKDFVKRVDGIPDLLKEPHIKPQHYFVDYYRKRNPNVVILKLEKPDEINSFLSIYSLEMPLLNASKEDYDYRAFYDPDTFERVARMYRTDVKMFRYEQESRALRDYLQSVEK
ncbi:MAG TPA: sulfotransferase family 2 domain-containing protein [Chryseosolibacter sp.]